MKHSFIQNISEKFLYTATFKLLCASLLLVITIPCMQASWLENAVQKAKSLLKTPAAAPAARTVTVPLSPARQALKSKQTEIQELQVQLNQLATQRDALKKSQTGQRGALNQQISVLQDNIQSVQATDLPPLQRQVVAEKVTAVPDIPTVADVQNNYGVLADTNNKLATFMYTQRPSLEALQATLKNQNDRLTQLNNQWNYGDSQLLSYKEQIKALQAKNNPNAQAEIVSLQQVSAQLEAALKKLSTEHQQIATDLQSTLQDLNEHQDRMNLAVQRSADLSGVHDAYFTTKKASKKSAQADEQQRQQAALQANPQLADSLADFKRSLLGAYEKRTSLEKELAVLKPKYNQLIQEKQALVDQMSQKQKQLNAFKRSVKRFLPGKKDTQLQLDISRLETQLVQKNREIADLRVQWDPIQNEITQVKEELAMFERLYNQQLQKLKEGPLPPAPLLQPIKPVQVEAPAENLAPVQLEDKTELSLETQALSRGIAAANKRLEALNKNPLATETEKNLLHDAAMSATQLRENLLHLSGAQNNYQRLVENSAPAYEVQKAQETVESLQAVVDTSRNKYYEAANNYKVSPKAVMPARPLEPVQGEAPSVKPPVESAVLQQAPLQFKDQSLLSSTMKATSTVIANATKELEDLDKDPLATQAEKNVVQDVKASATKLRSSISKLIRAQDDYQEVMATSAPKGLLQRARKKVEELQAVQDAASKEYGRARDNYRALQESANPARPVSTPMPVTRKSLPVISARPASVSGLGD